MVMSGKLLQSKCKVTGLHFLLSLLAVAALLWVMLTQWFPDFLFRLDGGWEGLKIVIAVDLVLGPILTFILYKKGKPGLKLDMSVIAIMQVLGFVYGCTVVWHSRPVALVFVKDSFHVVSADIFKRYDVALSVMNEIPGPYPKQIYILPQNPDTGEPMSFTEVAQGQVVITLAYRYYSPMAEHFAAVAEQTRDISAYIANKAEYQQEYQDFLQRNGVAESDLLFYPVYSRYDFYILVLSKSEQRIVDVLWVPYPYPAELPYVWVEQKRAQLQGNNALPADATEEDPDGVQK